MLHLRKFLGIIEAPISHWKELSLRVGRALVYFFKYIKTYDVKTKKLDLVYVVSEGRIEAISINSREEV